MRITTQMLNATARKAGLPINNVSLLNYVNNSGSADENTLLGSLSHKNSKTSSASSKLFSNDTDTYEKLENSADNLVKAAESLAQEGENSVFDKAEKSGSNEEIYGSVEKLVKYYNSMAENLKSTTGPLNAYYYQMLTEAAEADKNSLDVIGVSISKDGSLNVDKEKLSASSLDALKKAVGVSGTFTSKVAYLAGRVADNAKTNVQYATSQYNSKGDSYYSSKNQYDFWG